MFTKGDLKVFGISFVIGALVATVHKIGINEGREQGIQACTDVVKDCIKRAEEVIKEQQ